MKIRPKNKYIYFFYNNDIYENAKIMIIITKTTARCYNKAASGRKKLIIINWTAAAKNHKSGGVGKNDITKKRKKCINIIKSGGLIAYRGLERL